MNTETFCAQLEATLHKEIPISRFMGIRVLSFERDSLVISADLQPNINIHGTAFAGSLYSICALAGWGLVTLAIATRSVEASVVVASGSIGYLKPVQDEKIIATATFTSDLPAALEQYADTGKAQLSVDSSIKTRTKQAVSFQGAYALRRVSAA